MIAFEKNGQRLDLGDATFQLEWSNTMFSDSSLPVAYTLPFDIPYTVNNARLTRFPSFVNNTYDRQSTDTGWTFIVDGLPWMSGELLIYESSLTIKVAFQVKNFDDIKDKALKDLDWGDDITYASVADFVADAKTISQGDSDTYNYAFPTVVNIPMFEDRSFSTGGKTVAYIFTNYYDGADYLTTNPDYVQETNEASLNLSAKKFGQSMIPFPYLVYLIKHVFSLKGSVASGSFMTNDDVKKIVTFSNNVVGQASSTIIPETSMNLKNHVPNCTVSEFFNGLRKFFNLGYFWDSKGNVELICNKDLLADNSEVLDLTDRAIPSSKSISFVSEDLSGLNAEAPLIQTNLAAIRNWQYGTAVKKMDVLFGTITNDVNRIDPLLAGGIMAPIGQIQQRCNLTGDNYYSDPNELTNWLGFYIGFQSYIAGAIDMPVVTANGYDGSTYLTEFNLTLNETYGTTVGIYDYFWKDWLEKFLSKTREVTYNVKLTTSHLINLSMKQKVKVKDGKFFIRRVRASFNRMGVINTEMSLMKI